MVSFRQVKPIDFFPTYYPALAPPTEPVAPVTGSAADAFYRSLGWHETGVVPNYALNPDGQPWAATFFWKDLR